VLLLISLGDRDVEVLVDTFYVRDSPKSNPNFLLGPLLKMIPGVPSLAHKNSSVIEVSLSCLF
jgi:hypothetical protein